VEAVAKELKVKPEEVLEMESRLAGSDVSFQGATIDGEDSYGPEDYLAVEGDAYEALEEAEWEEEREDKMKTALATLDDRSRDILQRRWLADGAKAGLQELGDEYGVSAERIRQIEAAAMKKLRKAIEVPA
jgi:RNA polymerase sigma-32 factor